MGGKGGGREPVQTLELGPSCGFLPFLWGSATEQRELASLLQPPDQERFFPVLPLSKTGCLTLATKVENLSKYGTSSHIVSPSSSSFSHPHLKTGNFCPPLNNDSSKGVISWDLWNPNLAKVLLKRATVALPLFVKPTSLGGVLLFVSGCFHKRF